MTEQEPRTFQGKEAKLIAVVPRELLFHELRTHFFDGFKPFDPADDYYNTILRHYGFMTRGSEKKGFAEKDSEYKQPIAYCAIVNSGKRSVFVYERSPSKEDYHEDRLRGLLSLGIGGHIDYEDQDSQDIIRTSMLREIKEEVNFSGEISDPKLRGFINLEHGVHAVHFGLFYIIETDSEEIRLRGKEGCNQLFVPLSELESRVSQFEEWSQVAIPNIRHYLEHPFD